MYACKVCEVKVRKDAPAPLKTQVSKHTKKMEKGKGKEKEYQFIPYHHHHDLVKKPTLSTHQLFLASRYDFFSYPFRAAVVSHTKYPYHHEHRDGSKRVGEIGFVGPPSRPPPSPPYTTLPLRAEDDAG